MAAAHVGIVRWGEGDTVKSMTFWQFLSSTKQDIQGLTAAFVQRFSAVLPFRRFNKNWYKAMAGAALLGNSEIAGGMYVFNECGGEFGVVCKRLEYKFLRPCVGPAIYTIPPSESITDLAATNREFNITLEMEIYQMMRTPQERGSLVGRCTATFHATSIAMRMSKLPACKRSSWER